MFKRIIIIIFICLALGAVLLLVRGDEDAWICQDGQWVKHGNPSAAMPAKPCGPNNPRVIISQPKSGQSVTSPLEITGQARGTWFFEGSFPVKLLDKNRQEIAASYVQAQGEWMTENWVEFRGILTFANSAAQDGWLVLLKDNPSGLAELDEQVEIPIKIEKTEITKVNVFFNNNKMDPEFSCNKVFPTEREIPKTQAVARAALEELLKGPTKEEKAAGFITNINSGVKIQSLVIESGVARVDFDEQLEYQVGGSCRVAAISAEIVQTLKQFPTVQEVVISVNGRTEDILQP
jgi:hypothetical protein